MSKKNGIIGSGVEGGRAMQYFLFGGAGRSRESSFSADFFNPPAGRGPGGGLRRPLSRNWYNNRKCLQKKKKTKTTQQRRRTSLCSQSVSRAGSSKSKMKTGHVCSCNQPLLSASSALPHLGPLWYELIQAKGRHLRRQRHRQKCPSSAEQLWVLLGQLLAL